MKHIRSMSRKVSHVPAPAIGAVILIVLEIVRFVVDAAKQEEPQ